MTSLPKAMRRAVLTAKTLATAIVPEFKRTPLATGGVPDVEDSDDDSPYYSPLAQGLKGAKLETGPAAYWKNTISKLPGAAEAKDTGLHDFIDSQGGDIQKQALLEHLAMNSPQLQEHWFEEDPKRKLHENRPRFTDHTLDGGTNHKELSINLPPSPGAGGSRLDEAQKLAEEAGDDWEALGPNQRQHYEDLASPRAHVSEKDFLSPPGHRYGHDRPHHADVNRIAHVRMNDRGGPKGEKLLHIDELQSDWHQRGREHGYASQKYQYRVINKASGNESQAFNTEAEAREYLNKLPESLRGRVSIKHGVVKTDGVPNAPLKDTKQWTELALRRAIKHAADNGYHGVTWTTGDQQADRYDLSKHVKRVAWHPETGHLVAVTHTDTPIDAHDAAVPKDRLGDFVGKGAAEKLLKSEKNDAGYHVIESNDLRVGGEGMRKFYDEIVPSVANKIGREHGVQASKIRLPDPEEKNYTIMAPHGGVGPHHLFHGDDPVTSSIHREALERHRDRLLEAHDVHYLPVTPSMAGKKVRKYKRGGTVKPELGPAMMIAANVLNRKKRGQ